MSVLVAILLFVFLFGMLAVASYFNKKTPVQTGYSVKGYESMCKKCSVKNCGIRQTEYEEDQND